MDVCKTIDNRMDTLNYIIEKYNIDLNKKSPFNIECDRLKDLPLIFRDLEFKIGAEIGVAKGCYSEKLCQFNPNLKLYSIDSWVVYPIYHDFRKQKNYDYYYKEATERLKPYNCAIIKKYSMDAVKDFEDESLDFIFIDADHRFEFVANDIAHWGKKVRKDGIISGHDFGRSRNSNEYVHVKDVVYAWTYSHGIHPWFILNGESRTEKSWMWVKK